jgi:signal transduction histidine kinase
VHPLARALDHAPTPFAITAGPTHAVVYANGPFRRLVGADRVAAVPLDDVLLLEATTRLGPLLDRAFGNGVAVLDHFLGRRMKGAGSWTCSIWPLDESADSPEGLMIELRMATHAGRDEALRREVSERLLLSALREAEAADAAEAERGRTAFLLAAGRRLAESLDETVTRDTMAGVALPALGAWCIVDVIEPDDTVTRLAMVHPDPEKERLVRELSKHWAPQPGDPFGAPVVMRKAQPIVTKVEMPRVAEALAAASHTRDNLRLLSELGIGPLLTVPMVSDGRLLGAVTFVSGQPDRAYTPEDVELAEGLVARSAEALNSARLYSEALSLREQADASNHSRMRFLANIAHELRTPLNAIAGYAHLMQAEIHGPITDAQRHDLERINLNQEHLLVLIADLFSFVRASLTPVIKTVAVPVHTAVSRALALLEGLALKKSIHYQNEATDRDILADGDPDRLQQILLNLISNAVKFTPWEGTITICCEATEKTVQISVTDTGMGVDPEKIEDIFEPFVKGDPEGEVSGGVGLGLAISRDLARVMRGDVTVESTPGQGSCFTVTLPRRLS